MFTPEQIAEFRIEWMRAEESARTIRHKYITALQENAQSNQADTEALNSVRYILSSLDISREYESGEDGTENFQDELFQPGESQTVSEQGNGQEEMPGMSEYDGASVT